ncbi:hypothetical protein ACFPRL_34875 [Pseudoclavibacter helvolus]
MAFLTAISTNDSCACNAPESSVAHRYRSSARCASPPAAFRYVPKRAAPSRLSRG